MDPLAEVIQTLISPFMIISSDEKVFTLDEE